MKFPPGFSLVMLEGSLGTLLAAIYGILCARLWGPEISGMTSFAFALASVFAFLSCISIEQIVIARYVGGDDHGRLFLATLILRSAAIGASMLGIMLTSIANAAFLGPWLLLPALCFLQLALSAIDLLRLRAQAMGMLHRQSIPRMGISLVFFLMKYASLVTQAPHESVWTTLWLTVVESALLLVTSVLITRSTAPLEINRPVNWNAIKGEIRGILHASLPLFGASLLVMLFFKLDYFMLSELSTPYDIGLYAAAMRVMEMYVAIANLALLQFYPLIAQAYSKSADDYAASLRSAFRLAYLLSFVIIAFNLLVGAQVIGLLLGPRYEEVALYSTVFCLLSIPLLSGTVRGFAISLQGLHRNHFFAAAIGFGFAIPLMFLLIPSLGFKGALISDLIAYTTSAMLSSLLIPSLRSVARHQWMPGFHKS